MKDLYPCDRSDKKSPRAAAVDFVRDGGWVRWEWGQSPWSIYLFIGDSPCDKKLLNARLMPLDIGWGAGGRMMDGGKELLWSCSHSLLLAT